MTHLTTEEPALPGEPSKMHDIVNDLREYAANPGYSHGDYADTMRKAAHAIESLRAQLYHWGAAVEQQDQASDERAVKQVRAALGLAMTICDAVPTRAHDLADDESLRHLGKLVNCNMGNGQYGYAVIRDAQAAFAEVLASRFRVQGGNTKPDSNESISASAPKASGATGERMSNELRDWLEGMSVSMDVSTGDHDAHHRYFGIINEVMDDAGDKHGVTLLVYDAKPNFEVSASPAATEANGAAVPDADAKDAARLDWLAYYGAALRIDPEDGRWFLDAVQHTKISCVDDHTRFDTPRAAIDAAIAAAPAAPEQTEKP